MSSFLNILLNATNFSVHSFQIRFVFNSREELSLYAEHSSKFMDGFSWVGDVGGATPQCFLLSR